MASGARVVIVAHDANWASEFALIGRSMRDALGPAALRIDHIGSTAVAGLAAKPVIDVQISVLALEPVGPFCAPLEALGYRWRRGEKYEKTKRYFRESGAMRRTHVHVRRAGSWNEQFALLFRDFLRHGADACDEYERVKRTVAARYPTARAQYTHFERCDPVVDYGEDQRMGRADRMGTRGIGRVSVWRRRSDRVG